MITHQSDSESLMNLGFTTELFPLGTHMCYLYKDDEERRRVMAQYTNAGIAAGEFTGYFANVKDDLALEDYLVEMGVRLPDQTQRERTLLARTEDVYCPNHTFTAQGTLDRLRALHEHCVACGVAKIRITGEMMWALAPDVRGTEQLVEYEARVNLLLETHPLTAVCQYDANQFNGALLFDILQVHPMIVVRGQVVRNPYYTPARDYLRSQGLSAEN